MHTKEHEPPDPNYNYEVRDLPVHDIVKAVFWFYVLVVVSAPVCILILNWMGGHVGSGSGPDHYELRRMPQEGAPLLQDGATAHVDLGNLRRQENAILSGVDPVSGRRYLKIDDAIRQEAEEKGR